MLTNHLKVAWRNLRKNRIYTVINIIGLSAGIAATLLIFRIVHFELGFNKQFSNYDRIYRVVSTVKTAEEGEHPETCTPIPAMDVMQQTVSQLEALARVHEVWPYLTVPNPAGGAPLKKFGMDNGTAFFVDAEFFKVFEPKWLSPPAAEAMAAPGAIVLTKAWAEKCFDHWEAALNQTLMLDNLVPVQVKGVVDNFPEDCDFPLPFMISYETMKANADLYYYDEHWGNCSSNNQVYALLREGAAVSAANAALAKVGEKEYSEGSNVQSRIHHLQPLSDLHYNPDYGASGNHIITKSRLKILSVIGILILFMAAFNFINLATAQATLRAREVGVRKTLGSGRGQLIGQFMSETGLIVLGSVVTGVIIAALCTPLLKYVSDVPEQEPFLSQPIVWGFLIAVTILITLLAGLYPSFALSSFQPIKALKSESTAKSGGAGLRKSLVVVQFVVAQGLIIGAIITLLQLEYIRSRDLGFDKSLVYNFSFGADSSSNVRQGALIQALKTIPEVQSVSLSSDQPFSGNTWTSNFKYSTRPDDEPFGINLKFADAQYAETYGLKLVAGRWLEPSDTMREAVVNETLLRKLGIADPQEILGQDIRLGGRRILKIAGVVSDFHTHSLRRAHEPLLMTTRKEFYWDAGIKLKSADVTGTIAALNRAFDQVFPEQVFSGQFFDENIERFYEDDRRLSATCKAFGLLAILISCLGLFGLATHAAAQRVKEIGIRKVLGASVSGIVGLLSKDFLTLVSIAIVLASPPAWYLMNQWLDNFVYRIHIPWWVFLSAAAGALAIAFLTVSYQSVRAALANPIKSLRSE